MAVGGGHSHLVTKRMCLQLPRHVRRNCICAAGELVVDINIIHVYEEQEVVENVDEEIVDNGHGR